MSDDYSQPDFYRFNQDSLELVRFVLTKISACHSLLDLGAGSGIIGIELARSLEPAILSLLELQEDYRPHLEDNLKRFLTGKTEAKIHMQSFGEWTPEGRFDLVVCNPPYYLPGKGRLPKDERRARARAFLRDDWWTLFACIERSLSEKGRAYLVVKNDEVLLQTIRSALSLRAIFHKKSSLIFIELSRLNVN